MQSMTEIPLSDGVSAAFFTHKCGLEKQIQACQQHYPMPHCAMAPGQHSQIPVLEMYTASSTHQDLLSLVPKANCKSTSHI